MAAQAQNYSIRKMQKNDLEKVTALEAACFSMPWKYKDFEEALINPHRIYLVAETDWQEIIGGCMLAKLQRLSYRSCLRLEARNMEFVHTRLRFAARIQQRSGFTRMQAFAQKASDRIFMRNQKTMRL